MGRGRYCTVACHHQIDGCLLRNQTLFFAPLGVCVHCVCVCECMFMCVYGERMGRIGGEQKARCERGFAAQSSAYSPCDARQSEKLPPTRPHQSSANRQHGPPGGGPCPLCSGPLLAALARAAEYNLSLPDALPSLAFRDRAPRRSSPMRDPNLFADGSIHNRSSTLPHAHTHTHTRRLPPSSWTMVPACARPVSPATTPPAPSSPPSSAALAIRYDWWPRSLELPPCGQLSDSLQLLTGKRNRVS